MVEDSVGIRKYYSLSYNYRCVTVHDMSSYEMLGVCMEFVYMLVHLLVLSSFCTRKSTRWRTKIRYANRRSGNPARMQPNPVV